MTEVVDRLLSEGYEVGQIDLVFAKPLDTARLEEAFAESAALITVEEGCLTGGVGSAVLQLAMESGYRGRLPDEFIAHGSPAQQRAYCGLDAESIYRAARELLPDDQAKAE